MNSSFKRLLADAHLDVHALKGVANCHSWLSFNIKRPLSGDEFNNVKDRIRCGAVCRDGCSRLIADAEPWVNQRRLLHAAVDQQFAMRRAAVTSPVGTL